MTMAHKKILNFRKDYFLPEIYDFSHSWLLAQQSSFIEGAKKGIYTIARFLLSPGQILVINDTFFRKCLLMTATRIISSPIVRFRCYAFSGHNLYLEWKTV